MGRIAGVTPEETKGRLVDATARLFELKGYEGATVAQIAREAGVTSGAIYAHYSGKAELLVDALRVHRERMTASVFPSGSRADAATVLTTLGQRLANRDRADTDLLAEALLAARHDAELAQVLSAAMADRERVVAALVARGQHEGALTDEMSADVAARFSVMLGLGSMLVSALDMPAIDPAEWSSFISRFVGSFAPERVRAGAGLDGASAGKVTGASTREN